jgi:8-oxo-dGTP diphosphatase
MALYKFCPLCGDKLEYKLCQKRKRPTCPSCGFIHYQNPVPAAGCVVFQKGKLLMVQRAHEPFVGDWTIPAGYCEWEENPAVTAVRELKEETGLDVSITRVFKIYNGYDDPRTNAILVLYFADIIGGELRPADDALRAVFFAWDEIPKNIAFEAHRQALTDLKTSYPERFESHAD